MMRRLTVIVALGLVVLAGVLYMSRSTTPPDPLGAAFAQDAAEVDTSNIKDMSIGNPDAKVTVIEYASFTCPHCAAFHAENFKLLKADFIDTGKINFIYREVYFDRFGLWASIVARCGENPEARFFGIADMLYAQQKEWVSRGMEPAEIVGALRKIGKTAGLNDAELDNCLTDADGAQALYALYLRRVEEDGVESTPTFIINGTKYTNMPYSEMKTLIDEALAG